MSKKINFVDKRLTASLIYLSQHCEVDPQAAWQLMTHGLIVHHFNETLLIHIAWRKIHAK